MQFCGYKSNAVILMLGAYNDGFSEGWGIGVIKQLLLNHCDLGAS